MVKIVGIRFKKSGKTYYFDPTNIDIKKGDFVIVETVRGLEFGEVVIGIKDIVDRSMGGLVAGYEYRCKTQHQRNNGQDSSCFHNLLLS